jgi:hypothetical protein
MEGELLEPKILPVVKVLRHGDLVALRVEVFRQKYDSLGFNSSKKRFNFQEESSIARKPDLSTNIFRESCSPF